MHADPTEPGRIVGTVAYMSPEQAEGKPVDARSDIFSFGAVLYEMVTGRRAFPGTSAADTLAAVLRDEPKPPREIVPEVPRDLERIILRCLRKDPDRRFQHMADVKVELQEVKEESRLTDLGTGRSVSATRRSVGARCPAVPPSASWPRRWPRRRQRRAEGPPPVVALSSARHAGGGSFSPDGTQIVYQSAGREGTNWDVWLKIVGESEAAD